MDINGIISGMLPWNQVTDILDVFGIGTQRRAQENNSAEAVKQRAWEEKMTNQAYDWQEKMRSTEYQAAVEGMKQAGLNPALMYNSGSTVASTPSATVPSGASANSAGGIAGSMVQGLTTLINAHNTARLLEKNNNKNTLQKLIKLLK